MKLALLLLLCTFLPQDRETVYKKLIESGYRQGSATLANEAKAELTTLSRELAETEAAEVGRNKPFRHAREKAIRVQELKIRLARVEHEGKKVQPPSWVEPIATPVETVESVEVGQLYSVGPNEVVQVVDDSTVHAIIRVGDPSARAGDKLNPYWFEQESTPTVKRIEQGTVPQRVSFCLLPETGSLYVGKPLFKGRIACFCLRISEYETSSGTNRIPEFIVVDADWKEYLKANRPAEANVKAIAPEPYRIKRQWSDATGKFNVTAELLKVDGSDVTLKKDDGKELTLKVSILSVDDRNYLEGYKQSLQPFESKIPQEASGFGGAYGGYGSDY